MAMVQAQVVKNIWRMPRVPRIWLALLAVLLLSVPSAIGVQKALAPTRGELAGWLAAAGFELVYLSTAVLALTAALRVFAQNVALASVITAIVLNTIADYQQRVPLGLKSYDLFAQHFDILALILSVIESVPLAGLSFAMATLLHRISEHERAEREREQQAADDAQDVKTLAQERAELSNLAAQLRNELAQVQHHAAQAVRNHEITVRELRAEIEQLRAAANVDVIDIAQQLRESGMSLRNVAQIVCIPESTLRNKLKSLEGVAQ